MFIFSPNFFFPPDFFKSINSKKISPDKITNLNKGSYEYKPKSIYIDITKEEEEDKELLSLLEGKRMYIIYFIINIIII